MAKGKGGGSKPSAKTQVKKQEKVIEDKTFGLKNKNKSKKVQQYIAQVSNSGGRKGHNQSEAELAAKRKAKEAAKQAEKEMFALLGNQLNLDKKNNKKKAKEAELEKQKKLEDEAKQKEMDEKDFGVPFSPLRDIFGQGSKIVIERICCEMVHKDNLPGKAWDSSPCLYIKVKDGTTLNPMTMCLYGETPTSFRIKVNSVIDVRGATAMVRGSKVMIELPKGTAGLSSPNPEVNCSIEVASERLSQHIRERTKEEEEIRARGGIPIEERIEEERANLAPPLTPVTKERFMEWKLKKQQAREAEKAKTGGTRKVTQSSLTGRALFNKDKSLFMQDTADGVENVLGDGVSQEENSDEKGLADQEEANLCESVQENLYLQCDDDDLDDLDDLDDESDEE